MKRSRDEQSLNDDWKNKNIMLMSCALLKYILRQNHYVESMKIYRNSAKFGASGLRMAFCTDNLPISLEIVSYRYSENSMKKQIDFQIRADERNIDNRYVFCVTGEHLSRVTQRANALICRWINEDPNFLDESAKVQWSIYDDHLRLYQPKRDATSSKEQQEKEKKEITFLMKRIWEKLTGKTLCKRNQIDNLKEELSGQLSIGSASGAGGMYLAWEGYSLSELFQYKYLCMTEPFVEEPYCAPSQEWFYKSTPPSLESKDGYPTGGTEASDQRHVHFNSQVEKLSFEIEAEVEQLSAHPSNMIPL